MDQILEDLNINKVIPSDDATPYYITQIRSDDEYFNIEDDYLYISLTKEKVEYLLDIKKKIEEIIDPLHLNYLSIKDDGISDLLDSEHYESLGITELFAEGTLDNNEFNYIHKIPKPPVAITYNYLSVLISTSGISWKVLFDEGRGYTDKMSWLQIESLKRRYEDGSYT